MNKKSLFTRIICLCLAACFVLLLSSCGNTTPKVVETTPPAETTAPPPPPPKNEVPGLYDGDTLIKPWDDMVAEELLQIQNGMLANVSKTLVGNIVIPNTIVAISPSAFAGSPGLTGVYLGKNLISIGASAFQNCVNLQRIEMTDSITRIGASAFAGCALLDSVVIGNNVVIIEENAFLGCNNLEYVVISDGVTSVGDAAFANCANLREVYLGKNVTKINKNTFTNCVVLQEITINSKLSTVGTSVFQNCNSLRVVKVDDETFENIALVSDGNEQFTSSAIYRSDANFEYDSIMKKIAKIEDDASLFPNPSEYTKTYKYLKTTRDAGLYKTGTNEMLASWDYLVENGHLRVASGKIITASSSLAGDIVFPGTITEVGQKAFFRCAAITGVYMGDSVKKIENYAFSRCTSLYALKLSSQLTTIEPETFYGCTNLGFVIIPDRVKQIGRSAFEKCSALKVIAIGKEVNSVETNAFYGCTKVEYVVYEETFPANKGSKWNSIVVSAGNNDVIDQKDFKKIVTPSVYNTKARSSSIGIDYTFSQY